MPEPACFRLGSLLLAAAVVLAACEPPDRYPVSGEQCRAGDPVQSLDQADFDVPCD